MKRKKSFLSVFPQELARFRVEFRLLGAKEIEDFVVQLETQNKHGEWKEAVRYDFAHGHFHLDIICLDGTKAEEPKEIKARNLEDAALKGMEDLRKNVRDYLEKAGHVEIAKKLISQGIGDELERQKCFLVNLIRQPEEIDNIPDVVGLSLHDEIKLKDRLVVILKDGKTGNILRRIECEA